MLNDTETETGWASGVLFPAGTGEFYLLHSEQTVPGISLTTYAMDTGGSLPGGKLAGT
jgi:hypothetical protein